MGVDSKVKLTSNPKVENVYDFLNSHKLFSNVKVVDFKEAHDKTYTAEDGTKKTYRSEATGWINLTYHNPGSGKDEERSLFIIESYFDKSEESSNVPFTPTDYFYASLGKWGGSVEIFRILAGEFGGYVIPDDCADENNDDYFEIINGTKEHVISDELASLLDNLVDMSKADKFELIKKIDKNKEVILNYLKSI